MSNDYKPGEEAKGARQLLLAVIGYGIAVLLFIYNAGEWLGWWK